MSSLKSNKPAYGAFAHLYSGKDITEMVEKVQKLGRSGLIDEYYDIKAGEPQMDFTTAR